MSSSCDITPHTLDEVIAATCHAASSSLVLPALPHEALGAERVQLVIRGRRFEASAQTLAEYCLALRLFFGLPLANSNSSATVDVLQLVQSRTEAEKDSVAAALLAHYTQTVLPHLAEALRELMRQHYYNNSSREKQCERLVERLRALPPLPVPEAVDYDATQHLWRIAFPRRLDTSALQAITSNSSSSAQAKSGGSKSAASASSNGSAADPNDDPALLLQADYVGALLVFLRRAHQVHQAKCEEKDNKKEEEGNKMTATQPLRLPTLPLRWAEMTHEQQLSLTQVVRGLGIATLLPCFGLPARVTARSTDRAHDDNSAQQDKANEKEEEEKRRGMENEEERDVLSAVGQLGCTMCGRAGHDSDHCPFAAHA